MSEEKTLKVQIQYGELKQEIEGSVEEVAKEALAFITKICPNYDLASKLLFTADYTQLAKRLADVLCFTQDGQLILKQNSIPADHAILAILMGSHLAYKTGRRRSEEMSAEEISKTIAKAIKTIRNTLAEMVKNGTVERAQRGTYKITASGIIRIDESLKAGASIGG